MVTRQWKRELISRCYNLLIKAMFRNDFSDAQCGFKAIKRSVAQKLLPQVEDNEWFFDTELLLLAEEQGYRISEVPVDWIEDLDSRVDVVRTALDDLRGMARVARRQLPSFAAATLVRFVLLRSWVFSPNRTAPEETSSR